METSHAKAARGRLGPFAVWVGCACLAGSLAGASWVVNNLPAETVTSEPSNGPRPLGRVVCQGYVDVESGVIPLYPLQPGRVKTVFIHDNDSVEADVPLFLMDDTLAKAQVAEAKADLAASQVRLTLGKRLIEQHQTQKEGQKAAIEAKTQELNGAKAKHNQAKRLSESRLGSADDTRIALAAVKGTEAAIAAEKAKLRGVEALDPSPGIKQVEREIDAKKAQLDKAEYALRECTIRAPRKGKVLRLLISEGEMLGATPRQPAIQFCPDGPRIIRAEVEQEFADRIVEKQAAKIHDDSSGDIRWTGTVTRIGDWYTHRRCIVLEPLQFNDVRTLECIITVDPTGPPLRIGQRVRVTLENGN